MEVTLNVKILGALGSGLRPSFVQFQQMATSDNIYCFT